MNLYFLVEGASTETKFYPALIESIFGNSLIRILNVQDIKDEQNSFYVLSGNGYPQIYTHILQNAIEDINQYKNYNYLFVCLDADEMTVKEREIEFAEAYNEIVKKGIAIDVPS